MIDAKKKPLKKITKQRLKNIALYYLKRFDSSVANLRTVLSRRVNDYAYQNNDFDKEEARGFVEDILAELEGYGYLNDGRYAEIKVRGYLAAGKSARYIVGKLKEKGVDEDLANKYLNDSEYDPFDLALRLAKKKRIGPFREEGLRKEFWQKDMAVLVRVGFDYEIAKRVMEFID